MATLQATRIRDALAKARGVGRIEEPLTIAGCEVVLQNLTPHEFESILSEIEDLEDAEYAFAYQINHVARSVVELNGQDLRDVEFIEDEVPAGAYLVQIEAPSEAAAKSIVAKLKEAKLEAQVIPPDGSETRVVKLERYQWIRDYVLSTWTKEALMVGWRKFMELLVTADEKAKEGIQFRIPDETAEERFRRLLNELRETSEELPDEMVDNLLVENNLIRKSSQEELDQVNERLEAMRQPQQPPEEPQAPAQAPAPSVASQAPQGAQAAPQQPPEAVQAAMAGRQPLNTQPTTAPAPPASPQRNVQSAQRKAAVPEQIRQAAYENSVGIGRGEPPVLGSEAPAIQGGTQPAQRQPVTGGIPTRAERSAQIAQLEAQVDPTVVQADVPMAPVRQPQHEVRELAKPQEPLDSKQIASIVDKPPVVGVNKKFKQRR